MYPKHYFDLFRSDIEEDLVFVGMSFHPADVPRWSEIIQPAIANAGMRGYRVDAGIVSDSVITDIMRGIMRARLLVFDISANEQGNRNGNVMYEVGLAHAMRLPEEAVLIRSDTARLLFDVQGIRVLNYSLNDHESARFWLTEILVHLRSGVASLKESILQKVASGLDEVCLGFMAAHAGMIHFSLHEPEKAFTPETVAGRTAVRHLLDNGVLSMLWKREQQKYAFTWTAFGRALLGYLGLHEARESSADSEEQQQFNYKDK